MTLNEIGHDGRVDNVRILQRLSGGQEAKKPQADSYERCRRLLAPRPHPAGLLVTKNAYEI